MTLEELGIENDMPKGWVRGKSQPKWHRSLYDRWKHMWERCSNPNHKDYSNYKDCKIDERYRKFSNYVSDIMKLENFDKLCENPSKYHIDKDRVDPNNRCYYFEHLTIMTDTENNTDVLNRYGTPFQLESTLKKRRNNARKIIGIPLDVNKPIILLWYLSQAKPLFDLTHIGNCCKKKEPYHKKYKWYYVNYKHGRKYRIGRD